MTKPTVKSQLSPVVAHELKPCAVEPRSSERWANFNIANHAGKLLRLDLLVKCHFEEQIQISIPYPTVSISTVFLLCFSHLREIHKRARILEIPPALSGQKLFGAGKLQRLMEEFLKVSLDGGEDSKKCWHFWAYYTRHKKSTHLCSGHSKGFTK